VRRREWRQLHLPAVGWADAPDDERPAAQLRRHEPDQAPGEPFLRHRPLDRWRHAGCTTAVLARSTGHTGRSCAEAGFAVAVGVAVQVITIGVTTTETGLASGAEAVPAGAAGEPGPLTDILAGLTAADVMGYAAAGVPLAVLRLFALTTA
jgi:hypothetical protein